MLPLPILNVRLHACPKSWQQLTPTATGHHCAQCATEVIDFTHSTAAELAAARAAAPGGQLCGRFRAGQLVGGRPVGVVLRPKLRRFLVALVLVCGLGLSSAEAWAQVRQAARPAPFTPPAELLLLTPEALSPLELRQNADPALPPLGPLPEPVFFGVYMEQMPTYRNGGQEGLLKFIRQHLQYPAGATAEGKVFVSFLVTKTGAVTDVRVMKGLEPRLDEAAAQVVRLLGPWTPGRQAGQPIDVTYTVPILFSRP